MKIISKQKYLSVSILFEWIDCIYRRWFFINTTTLFRYDSIAC